LLCQSLPKFYCPSFSVVQQQGCRADKSGLVVQNRINRYSFHQLPHPSLIRKSGHKKRLFQQRNNIRHDAATKVNSSGCKHTKSLIASFGTEDRHKSFHSDLTSSGYRWVLHGILCDQRGRVFGLCRIKTDSPSPVPGAIHALMPSGSSTPWFNT